MSGIVGKRALVCGASQGIGAASARALAALGCKIVAVARSEDKLNELTSQLPGDGHQAIVCDISDRQAVTRCIDQTLLPSGSIEIIINNTGGPPAGPLVEANVAEFTGALEHHLGSATLFLQACLPAMQASGYGRIVNVLSTSVRQPIPNLGVSNVIRSAMAAWAKTLSLEVGSFGITVNNVLPGYTETPRLEALISANAAKRGVEESTVVEQWRNLVPARRFGQPEEVAAAVAFLVSERASYINGVSLPVDGGRIGAI